jgi:hypothetical protein
MRAFERGNAIKKYCFVYLAYKKFMEMQNEKSIFQRHRFEVKVEITCLNLKNVSNRDNEGQLWC